MRRFVIGIVTVGLTLALVAPAFATGKQIICWTRSGGNYIPFWGARYSGMRFQTLIDKAQINYAGKINQVEFYNYWVRNGTFNAYKLILCHGPTSLSTTFASNYKGTPVTVATLSSFTIPSPQAWFPLGMTTTTFDYNNSDGLLIEIQWRGSGPRVDQPIYTGPRGAGNHRVWLYNNPTGPVGTGDTLTYYTRLSFGAYTAVAPTSLGRVKALYE